MYLAELHGKLPSNIERKEDILTSNVFSFFKYANRNVYLKELIKLMGLEVTGEDLENAEFIFWPNYDDLTQPDMVLIIGDYYLLWEAKYFSDIEYETDKPRSQIIREITGGLTEAKTLGKQFSYIVITKDYVYRENKFKNIPDEYKKLFNWLNWQKITFALESLLEKQGEDLPNYYFASDLHSLLEKKNLRSFQSFYRLKGLYTHGKSEQVFFSSESAVFRGKFMGFANVLKGLHIQKPGDRLFLSQPFNGKFMGFTTVLSEMNVQEPEEGIFFSRRYKRTFFQFPVSEISVPENVLFFQRRV